MHTKLRFYIQFEHSVRQVNMRFISSVSCKVTFLLLCRLNFKNMFSTLIQVIRSKCSLKAIFNNYKKSLTSFHSNPKPFHLYYKYIFSLLNFSLTRSCRKAMSVIIFLFYFFLNFCENCYLTLSIT